MTPKPPTSEKAPVFRQAAMRVLIEANEGGLSQAQLQDVADALTDLHRECMQREPGAGISTTDRAQEFSERLCPLEWREVDGRPATAEELANAAAHVFEEMESGAVSEMREALQKLRNWIANSYCEDAEVNEVIALADKALSARVSEWQPISTAPKDGTWLLLWGEGWSMPNTGQRSIYTGKWQCMDGDLYKVTHWQPLPSAPASPASGEGAK